jgi:hypothetical protein
VRAMGARLILAPVAPLSPSWEAFFRSIDVELAVCAPQVTDRARYLLGDGHPNGVWNAEYSHCLAKYLNSEKNQFTFRKHLISGETGR